MKNKKQISLIDALKKIDLLKCKLTKEERNQFEKAALVDKQASERDYVLHCGVFKNIFKR